MTRGGSFGPQTVLIVGVLIYVAALALLSPGLPAAFARFFGIKPTEAFAALVIIPCATVVIALLVVARRKRGASTDP
jgi:hypothetical protein